MQTYLFRQGAGITAHIMSQRRTACGSTTETNPTETSATAAKTAKKRACDILHLMGKVCWAEGRQGLSPHNIEQQLRVRDAGITAAAAAAFTVPAKSIDYTLTSVIR